MNGAINYSCFSTSFSLIIYKYVFFFLSMFSIFFFFNFHFILLVFLKAYDFFSSIFLLLRTLDLKFFFFIFFRFFLVFFSLILGQKIKRTFSEFVFSLINSLFCFLLKGDLTSIMLCLN